MTFEFNDFDSEAFGYSIFNLTLEESDKFNLEGIRDEIENDWNILMVSSHSRLDNPELKFVGYLYELECPQEVYRNSLFRIPIKSNIRELNDRDGKALSLLYGYSSPTRFSKEQGFSLENVETQVKTAGSL